MAGSGRAFLDHAESADLCPDRGIVAGACDFAPRMAGRAVQLGLPLLLVQDATFTLYALTMAGYIEEAKHWSQWLLRAVASEPKQMQTLYGVAGERRLEEFTFGLSARLANSGECDIGKLI